MKLVSRRVLALVILLLLLTVGVPVFVVVRVRVQKDRDVRCVSHLCFIGWRLHDFADTHDGLLPDSLDVLPTWHPAVLRQYVCPATGHRAGDARRISSWSDYSYYGKGCRMNDSGSEILAACWPSNHHGRVGVILYMDGSAQRYESREFAAIMQNLQGQTNHPAAKSPP